MRNLLFLAGVLSLAFLLNACSEEAASVSVSDMDIHYRSSVTRGEAVSLAKYLKSHSWADSGQKLLLKKRGLQYQLYWVVDPSFDVSQLAKSPLQRLPDSIQKTLWPHNEMEVWVCDEAFQSSWPVNELIGNKLVNQEGGKLFVAPSYTKQEANTLMELATSLSLWANPQDIWRYQQRGEAHYFYLIPAQKGKPGKDHEERLKAWRQQLEDSLAHSAWLSISVCDAFFKPVYVVEPEPYAYTMSFDTDQIRYTGDILSREAQRLGDFLKEQGILRNAHRKINVQLKEERYILMFKTRMSLQQRETRERAHELGLALSKYVFRGLPVDVHLYDQSLIHQVYRMN